MTISDQPVDQKIMETKQDSAIIHQILVKLLNGKHKALNFTTPIVPIEALKHCIETLTLIPSHLQLLTLSDFRILHDSQSLNLANLGQPSARTSRYKQSPEVCDGRRFPVVVYLLLRLRGGKGGFGSLLRGAATKAGQKKTNNFDACRDMSGRRLRHVNAEKKLEEWRAEAEERKLEKMAEEYIKKKLKETGGKKAKSRADAEKYVAKYREDSYKCMEEVDRAVRESLKGVLASKRKGSPEANESEAKKMKIWLGKRKLVDSDTEDMDDDIDDDDDDVENEKSVVVTNGNNSESSKEAGRSSDSVTGSGHNLASSEKGTSDSGSEEEKDVVTYKCPGSGGSGDSCSADAEAKSPTEAPIVCESESHSQKEKEVSNSPNPVSIQQTISQSPVVSGSGEEDSSLPKHELGSNPKLIQEAVSTNAEVLNLEKPLIFDEYSSAAELEVLGMERLKEELQARGLKCGGTLQERAARLFLLKTTPLEKLPKKLFAKK